MIAEARQQLRAGAGAVFAAGQATHEGAQHFGVGKNAFDVEKHKLAVEGLMLGRAGHRLVVIGLLARECVAGAGQSLQATRHRADAEDFGKGFD